MAHPSEEAGAGSDMDIAAAAFDQLDSQDDIDDADETNDNDDHSSEDEGSEEDLDLSEDDEEDESDEPGEPAIEAPVSLTAEEKAKFAALPKEAQQYVADLESRRAVQVQTATTKAAEAQRTAESAAARADAQAKAVYAQQLQVFADNLAPQRPDPQLAYTDPQAFIALNAQYEAQRAQHDQFVQQVTALSQEADEQMTEAEIAERDRALSAIPEVQNEETRNLFFEKSIGVAKVLGLDTAALNRASAGEWKALRQVSDWQEKASKYDAAMAKQMQRVRESKKSGSAKPNAVTSNKQGTFQKAKDRAKQTGDVRDAAAAIARLG